MTRTLNSNDDDANSAKTIKFLYSYGGKILPRHTDGKLRYVGGHTRVLSVDRSVTFAELMVRFGELCGTSMSLKCKLPSEDLDVLVSVTCDEDLANVIDEYDRFKDLKIRAVLIPLKSLKQVSPPVSTVSSVNFSPAVSPPHAAVLRSRNFSPAFGLQAGARRDGDKFRYYPGSSPRHLYLVPLLNHWQ